MHYKTLHFMKREKHRLSREDSAIFESMKGRYVSEKEAEFFRIMRHREEYEITSLNDLIVSEYDNPDEIYLVREYYEEYLVGHGIGTDGAEEEHVMTLSEALSLNLMELGFISRNLTLLQWLRESGYRYVNYDRNYDLRQDRRHCRQIFI